LISGRRRPSAAVRPHSPHTALNLERHVSPDAVRRYKLTSLGAIGDAVGVIRRVRPDLTSGRP
jgi:hypothetical protein